MKVISFHEALKQATKGAGKKPHVLLGNGFSRACRNDIFAYEALFDRADFGVLSANAKRAFEKLKTTDFEVVIRALRNAAILCELYSGKEDALSDELLSDADGLREVLAAAVAHSHPSRPNDISDEEYTACRGFLVNFDKIYTLNYDLLLYWTVMHEELEPKVLADDGFRSPDEKDVEYVTWEIGNTNKQNIHYIHGALHLFDAGSELKKYTWSRTGVALIDQIRTSLAADMYPLIVAEGEAKQKKAKVDHSSYLSRCYRSFGSITGSLFVHGFSLSDSDSHLVKAIAKGKLSELYVSLHGDPTSKENINIIEKVIQLPNVRSKRNSLSYTFYDSASANVWGMIDENN